MRGVFSSGILDHFLQQKKATPHGMANANSMAADYRICFTVSPTARLQFFS